jgi:hypothetical protein
MTAKFKTASEAKAIGAALFAAGECTAWSHYPSFGKWMIRVQIYGKYWYDLTQADANATASVIALKSQMGVA